MTTKPVIETDFTELPNDCRVLLARTRYAGFHDHYLCKKLREVKGFSRPRI